MAKKITKTPAKSTDKKRKTDYERAEKIATLLSQFAEFFPRVDGSGNIPVLSREFTLKHLLGFTDKEYDINEELLSTETLNIYNAIKQANEQIKQADLTDRSKLPSKRKAN